MGNNILQINGIKGLTWRIDDESRETIIKALNSPVSYQLVCVPHEVGSSDEIVETYKKLKENKNEDC